MKKLLILLFALPLLALAQDNRNVTKAQRVFIKSEKRVQFEKALAAHAQRYHKGPWAWRVFTVESGPDAGAYHIVEGPATWDSIDHRGDLGQAHSEDWERNIAPLLQEKGSENFSFYRDDLSTVALTDYADRIAISHFFPKVGYSEDVESLLKMMRKAWQGGNESVAVYQSSSSGPLQYTIVTRYKNGLKERDRGYRKPFKERFEEANGAGSWTAFYLNTLRTAIDHVWSEMLFLHPELGSK